jgi:hypothetical protein
MSRARGASATPKAATDALRRVTIKNNTRVVRTSADAQPFSAKLPELARVVVSCMLRARPRVGSTLANCGVVQQLVEVSAIRSHWGMKSHPFG